MRSCAAASRCTATTGMVALENGHVALEHRLYASQRSRAPLSATALDVLPNVSREDLSAFDLPAPSADALPKSGALAFPTLIDAATIDTLRPPIAVSSRRQPLLPTRKAPTARC
jgi:hypothetical protein